MPPRIHRSLTGLLALCAALALPARGAAQDSTAVPLPPSGIRLDLNLPTNQLRVYDGDSLVKTYRVSVGLPGHDTPDGRFTVQRAEWNPWWRPPEREWAKDDKVTPPGPNNPMGRVKLFFAPYYYLHGTPHERDLGTAASHGCVRMLNRDVVELGRLLSERADATVPPSEITRILASHRNTRWSTFRREIPLTIRYEPVVVEDGELKVYRDIYRRNRIHTEGVIQALLGAGYDVRGLDRARVREVLRRAGQARGTYVVKVSEAFGELAMAAGG
ncbi:MAG TPA: L,D-transpeptidase [Longimicrobiaceae bacterium]|nr:L,D-transpeptidase [Longimicrobiaceae bacterium]